MLNIKAENRIFFWLKAVGGGLLSIIMAGPAIVVYRLAVSSSHFLDAGTTGPISFHWFANAATPYWINATVTSLLLGLAVTCAAVLLAVPTAFYHFRAGGWSSRVTDLLATTILLIPPISLAVGYYRSFGEGSVLTLLLGHILLAFPFPYFSLRVGLQSMSSDVADAAGLLGASESHIMLRILLPAVRSYLLLGALLAFLTSWDETVLSIFLTRPEFMTLPKAVWETMQRERDLTSAAINAILAPLFAISVVQLFIRSSRKASL